MNNRLSIRAITAEFAKQGDKVARDTVGRYLKMEGAPKPDRQRKYDPVEVRAFIHTQAPRALEGADIKELRRRKLEHECILSAIAVQKAKREVVPMAEILPALDAMASELRGLLQQKFEFELPSLCRGKSIAEIQAMNAAALDFIIERFRAGSKGIEGAAK